MFCRIRWCVCFPFLVNFRLYSSCCRLLEATLWGNHHPFRIFFVVYVYLVNKHEKGLPQVFLLLLFRTFLCVIACGKTVFLWFFCSERLFISCIIYCLSNSHIQSVIQEQFYFLFPVTFNISRKCHVISILESHLE